MSKDQDARSAKEDELAKEDDELRDLIDGPQGRAGGDYRRMFDLFTRLYNDAATIRSNPNAFMTGGAYNDKIINAYAKLMGLAMKGMESLNKMRNNDKMVDRMLNENVQLLSQTVSMALGLELKSIIDSIDQGAESEDIILRLKRLMNRNIPEIFLKAATETLESTRSEFGLLQ